MDFVLGGTEVLLSNMPKAQKQRQRARGLGPKTILVG